MPSSPIFTYLGDISFGIDRPNLSRYSNLGLKLSAQEFKKVKALEHAPGDSSGHKICLLCDQLLREKSQIKIITYHPGYRSLNSSASTCQLCSILVWSLEINLPAVFYDETRIQDTQEPDMEIQEEKIEIVGLPPCLTVKHNLIRFVVVWSGIGFQWGGDILGLYKETAGVPRIEPFWNNSVATNFDAHYLTIEGWIAQCQSHGASCASAPSPNLPTRILDLVSTSADSSICLVNSEGVKADFVALSHCWGQARPLTTTRATLAARMQRIELSELPKTFREAVEVVRKLKIRYLWIDTLCIIQDDAQDWEQEALNMCRVYQDAFLTIAASAATNSNDGLIRPFASSILEGRYRFGENEEVEELPMCIRLAGVNSRQQPTPLDARGWTLQEDLLSRRVLYFAEPQIFWRCKTITVSEDGLLDGIESEESRLVNIRNKFSKLNKDACQEAYKMWEVLAETYSRRHLTFEKDKLPALAGITVHFADLLMDEPILGLWRKNFVTGLLWERHHDEDTMKRNSVQSIPSWSWMAVIGAIEYRYFALWSILDHETIDYYVEQKLVVVSALTQWSGTPLSSELLKSELVVSGALVQASFTDDCTGKDKFVKLKVGGIGDGSLVGNGSLDCLMDTLPSSVWCLHVATLTTFDRERNLYDGNFKVLILQPAAEFENTYSRIGLAGFASNLESDGKNLEFEQICPQAHVVTISLI